MDEFMNCINRNEFSKKLSKYITENSSGIYCFIGKSGVGKKYVLHQIESYLNKFSILQVIDDSIYKKKYNRSNLQYNIGLSFQLGGFVGLSLSLEKSDFSKIDYIVSNLKKNARKRHVFISAINYDLMSGEGREFISILINNHQYIEERTKKKITIVITSINEYFSDSYKINRVYFQDYSKKDLYNYLNQQLKCSKEMLTNDKLDNIYTLCGTNYNLVNSYYKYIIYENTSSTINAIVDKKLNYYITSGYRFNISKETLQNILFLAADSISEFTPHMIANLDNSYAKEDIQKGLQCAKDEYFLKYFNHEIRKEFTNYVFISNKEKKYLRQIANLDHENIMASYYTYLSCYFEDEYLQRAQYLYKYYNKLTEEVFALLVLAISKSYMLNDIIAVNSTIEFFNKSNTKNNFKVAFENISKAFYEYNNHNYKKTIEIIKTINTITLSSVALAEIRRIEFKCYQLGHLLERSEMNTRLLQLKTYIDNGIKLIGDPIFEPKEEKLLEMRIIYDIAPYALDTQNNIQLFNELYNKSLALEDQIQQTILKKSYAEYIVNVFNRKAFLFATPPVALVYYEQAEAYFRENNINIELAITLSSKAGINTSLKRYREAESDLEEALKIVQENKIQVKQIEKIYNNLFLAQFLKYEEKSNSIAKTLQFAKKTISNLLPLVNNESNGKNHVILTNIASLYLYVGDFSEYNNIKRRIENSLNCKNVANIKDERINDFYRYHFAWFEFYRLLFLENWIDCKKLVDNLNGFYPAIFHDIKKMDLRIKAANYLIENKYVPAINDYSLHFLEYAEASPDYFSRGLLLSDLQFTSYD